MASPDSANGHKFLHTALRVTDIEKSVEFYSGLFNMKILYRRELDTATLVFLGHSDAAAPERPLMSREGVLELVAAKGKSQTIAGIGFGSTSHFIKMAFSVPDLPTTVKQLKCQNVKVVNDVGVDEFTEAVASFMDCKLTDLNSDKELRDALKPVCFVEDPNGYLIEIVQS
ncbi:hypothetical protein FNYG_15292 [Fusarium nygamai]|uniref:VOC domain-containing protein n=1 Tax=Gibberella nygamai TaxID=42673 RepID=A0A2K0UGN4_GIBNY|nr:hypothetical protein FNYG_15292 [Fusarium nygamai]